jgi:hypothetical protein
MNVLRTMWRITWRSVLVALGYLAGLTAAGMVGGILGMVAPANQSSTSAFGWVVIAGILLGVFLGPLAARLSVSRGQHFVLWASVIFFNFQRASSRRRADWLFTRGSAHRRADRRATVGRDGVAGCCRANRRGR